MKKILFILIFILTSGLSSAVAEEQLYVRDFSDGITSLEFCGATCFKSDIGEFVELSEMSCFELDNTLINSIDALEERLEMIIEEEDESKYISLTEDIIPRIKNKLSLIQTSINLNCTNM